MNRFGKMRMLSALGLLVASWMATGLIQAAPRAVIEVCEEPDAQVMWFRPNAMLFTDRNYRLAECPAGLQEASPQRGSSRRAKHPLRD